MFIRIIFLAFIGLFFILALDSYYNNMTIENIHKVDKTRDQLLRLAMKQVLIHHEMENRKMGGVQENVNQANSISSAAYSQQQNQNPSNQISSNNAFMNQAQVASHQQNPNHLANQNPNSYNHDQNQNQLPVVRAPPAYQPPAQSLAIEVPGASNDNNFYSIDRTVSSNPMFNTFQASPHYLYAQCTAPAGPTVFVKTHKTGSSTLTNIILRHADVYNLRAGLPPEGKWELGGYPAKIKKSLIDRVFVSAIGCSIVECN